MLTSLQQKFRVYGVDLRRNHKGLLKSSKSHKQEAITFLTIIRRVQQIDRMGGNRWRVSTYDILSKKCLWCFISLYSRWW